MKFENFKELVHARRSWYPTLFTNERIDDADLMECLKLASRAPTHRLTQPWRFLIYSDENKQDLGVFLAKKYKVNASAASFSEEKHKRTAQKPVLCSHVIAIIMKRDEQERVPEWEELAAVSCAVMSFWLAITAKGFGGYWSSPSTVLNEQEYFGLEEGEKCYGLFYLGIPAADAKIHEREYMPFEQLVRWK